MTRSSAAADPCTARTPGRRASMKPLLTAAALVAVSSPLAAQCLTWKVEPVPPHQRAFLGSYVALEDGGGTAAVAFQATSGNNAAIVFERVGLGWQPVQQLAFGSPNGNWSAPLAMDGGTIFMGDMDHHRVGVFREVGGSWTQVQVLQSTFPNGDSHFGRRMVIDGDRAVVAAPMDATYAHRGGSVVVFEWNGGQWIETAKIEPEVPRSMGFFGLAVALEGDTLVVGEPGYQLFGGDENRVFVYQDLGGQWTRVARLEGAHGTAFGYGVAIDGGRIAVGAYKDQSHGGPWRGSVSLYEDHAGWGQVDELHSEHPDGGDDFGAQVLLRGDRLVVGAGGSELDLGERVHLYHWQAGWRLATVLAPTGPGDWNFGTLFGAGLALDDETLLVGAPGEEPDTDLDVTGAAYFYALPALATPYCGPAVVNSTGLPGELSYGGCATLAQDDLALGARHLPPHRPGLFLVSRDQDLVPLIGGSQGTLCLGGAIGRYVDQLADTGSSGVLELAVDLEAIPIPGGSHAAQVGETWNFQCWYRDANPGPTSNLTDALRVTVR